LPRSKEEPQLTRVFALYSVREGASAEEFMSWSRTVDQVVMRRQPGVHRFEVYRVTASFRGKAPYDFVEDVEVKDWSSWLALANNEELKAQLGPEFERLIDAPNMVMICAERI